MNANKISQKYVSFNVCYSFFFLFSSLHGSQELVKHTLQQQLPIVFEKSENIVTAAISCDGTSYVIARKDLNSIDKYDRSTGDLSTMELPEYFFKEKTKDSASISFVNNNSKILLCEGNGKNFLLWNMLAQAVDTKYPYSYHKTVRLNPNDHIVCAYLSSLPDNELSNIHINEAGLSCTIKGFSQFISLNHSGIEWNNSGSHMLCHTTSLVNDQSIHPNNRICVVNHQQALNDKATSLQDYSSFLANDDEIIFSARWVLNDQYIVGLSPHSIFLWNTQDQSRHVITPQNLPHPSVSLKHVIQVENRKEVRYFYPGKIAYDKKKTKCFIEQAMGGYIITIGSDFVAKICVLKDFITNRSVAYYPNIQTLFNKNATILALLPLLTNTLSCYDTESGSCCGSVAIAPEKKILALDFNDDGDELYLRHSEGFDIYKVTSDVQTLPVWKE